MVWTAFSSFVLKCRRVWQVLRKPNKTEFLTVAKVSGIGILVLGVFGFLISGAMKLLIR